MLFSRLLRHILWRPSAGASRRAAALFAQGDAAQSRGEAEEAERCWREVLQLDPDHARALCRIGMLLGERGDASGAKPYFERARVLAPELAEAIVGLANSCWAEGDAACAETLLREALEIDPDLPLAHRNLGRVRLKLNDRADALRHLGRAWQLGMRTPEMLETLCRLQIESGDGGAAIGRLEAEQAAHPDDAEILRILGSAYRELQQPERARPWLERAVTLRDDDPASWVDLGIVMQHLGELKSAIACYDRALALRHDHELAVFHRALCLLLRGDFAAGWPGYELRLKSVERVRRRERFPDWNPEAGAGGRVLVYGEQGIGDEIMFASCLPDLVARGIEVVYEAAPRLATLMARSFPQATVYPASGDGVVPADIRARGIDGEIAIGSLPGHLRISRAAFPRHSGYLVADPARIARWRDRLGELGTGLKVGLSWRGGTRQSRHEARSLDLAQLAPALAVPGVRFVSLQYGESRSELRGGNAPISDWPEAIDDLEETAALVAALDLVVSVCTAVIHLGGALGRPVWVLAPYSPEWRYGFDGEAMAWYPTVRVLRQPALGNWEPVVAEAARRLRVLASGGDLQAPGPATARGAHG